MSHRTKPSGRALSNIADEALSLISITDNGDVNLHIEEPDAGIGCKYRCSRAVLRNHSDYFNVLLDPEKFSEGIAVEANLRELQKHHNGPMSTVPATKLPTITIADVGELSEERSICSVIRIYMDILHNPNMLWPVTRSQSAESVQLIALLAIVADRFRSQACIAAYLKGQNLILTRSKDGKSSMTHEDELENRQKLLAGIILEIPLWVSRCSSFLIMNGLQGDRNSEHSFAETGKENENPSQWWKLPGGIEGIQLYKGC